MHPTGVFLAGPPFEPGRQRLIAGGEPLQHRSDCVGRLEVALALAATLQLTHRLGAAQHQHRHQCQLVVIELQFLGQDMSVFERPIRRAVNGARQAAPAQRRQRPLDIVVGVRDHRFPAGRLIAGVSQGVQGQRIAVRCGRLLFDQAAQDADLFHGEIVVAARFIHGPSIGHAHAFLESLPLDRVAYVRSPKDFFKPLAVGAPEPLREIPFRPSRMIHFFPSSNEKMRGKVPDMVSKVDVLLANLEDGVPATDKEAARAGLVEVARSVDFGETQFWTRVNSLDSPWGLDDLTAAVLEAGQALDVIMIPKVEGPEDIHYVDRLLAQLEAKAGLQQPLMVHAILETARGVANVEEICLASPRMQGLSLGPADLAASRRMKTTRVGGGHPDYVVRQDPNPDDADAPRGTYQQDLWHYTIARMVDACGTAGILPFYGPFGDIADGLACEDQFRNAYLLGLRRRLVAASQPDRDRQACLLAPT